MEQVFLTILNMSITASWLVLAVIVLRFLLRKMPKSLVVVMWALVGIRLIFPFAVESELSLIPRMGNISNRILSSEYFSEKSGSNVEKEPSEGYSENLNTGVHTGTNSEQSTMANPVHGTNTKVDTENKISETKNFGKKMVSIGSGVWMIGLFVMCAYGVITYLRLYRKVSISLNYQKNSYLCDNIETPFILGIISPRIYIPSGTDQEQMMYVIEHERAHLQRKDHWWKPIGFVLLAVHWFNPIIWAAYILLCRDIELACDEKVIKNMNNQDKKGYSEALLACSVQRRMILACPLAFGEVGVKERVRKVKNYKKPTFLIIVVSVVVCIALMVGFLTNPKEDEGSVNGDYNLNKESILDSEELVFENSSVEMLNLPTEPEKKVNWGLTLSVENATPTGLTLVYNHVKENFKGKLKMGDDFHLCVKENGIWKNVEYKYTNSHGNSVDYEIPTNQESRQEVAWSDLYGELEPGVYKIGKKVDMQWTEDYHWQSAYFFAEFSIYTDKPSIMVEAELVPYPVEEHLIYAKAYYPDIKEKNAVPMYIIESLDFLEFFKTFFADYLNVDEDENIPSFEEATANMDEAYFEDYTLFVLYIRSNSSSWEYGVTNIEKTSNLTNLIKIHVGQTNHPQTLVSGDVGRMVLVPIGKNMARLRDCGGYSDNYY